MGSLFQSPSHRGAARGLGRELYGDTARLISVPFSSGSRARLIGQPHALAELSISVPFSSGSRARR